MRDRLTEKCNIEKGVSVYALEALFRRVQKKLPKATMVFIMSVRPFARNNSTPTGRILMKFHIYVFRKSVEKIQVSLKTDMSNGYFTWKRFHINDNNSLNS
jgi:hypothetical protein